MQRWEYARINVTALDDGRTRVGLHLTATGPAKTEMIDAVSPDRSASAVIHEHLDELGDEGWELTAVETAQRWSIYWLKREAVDL